MIQNVNKPTSPFWNKFILVCSAVSAGIAAWGKWGAHSGTIEMIGGIVGLLGVVIGILAPSSNEQKTD